MGVYGVWKVAGQPSVVVWCVSALLAPPVPFVALCTALLIGRGRCAVPLVVPTIRAPVRPASGFVTGRAPPPAPKKSGHKETPCVPLRGGGTQGVSALKPERYSRTPQVLERQKRQIVWSASINIRQLTISYLLTIQKGYFAKVEWEFLSFIPTIDLC